MATMPEVSEAEKAAIMQKAAGLFNAALVPRGLDDAARNQAVAQLYQRLEVIPRFGGPECRVRVDGGLLPFNAPTLARLVNEAMAEAAIAAKGPDPVELAADRVLATVTGADREEVRALLRGKLRRQPDGTIVGRLPSSRPVDAVNPTPPGAEVRGEAALDALARWAVRQLATGPSHDAVAAKRAAGKYGLL